VPKLPTQITGNAGLYYVCYELTKRGWNVLPTSRNAKGVDIVIYDENAERTHTVQVKALSKPDPVPLGNCLDHLIAEFLVVCLGPLGDEPRVFVMRCSEAKELAQVQSKDGKTSCWLPPKAYAPRKDAWELIGTGHTL